MNDYNITAKLAYELAIDCMDPHGELYKLAMEQREDMQGRQGHSEFLGGNGPDQPHHVKGRDMSGTFTLSDDLDYDERKSLEGELTSHQGSIDANGLYNVIRLARWHNGYDKAKAERAAIKRHNTLLGLPQDSAKPRAERALLNKAERAAKRLAKLQARHG